MVEDESAKRAGLERARRSIERDENVSPTQRVEMMLRLASQAEGLLPGSEWATSFARAIRGEYGYARQAEAVEAPSL